MNTANPSDKTIQTTKGDYVVSFDVSRLSVVDIHAYLTRAYWSENISIEVVKAAIAHSLCLGVYAPNGAQVGFARLITDQATFAYLADVYVLEAHQGLGLSKAMMAAIMALPLASNVRRFMLATRDAHGLYQQFGFAAPQNPQIFLEINRPDIYRPKHGRATGDI